MCAGRVALGSRPLQLALNCDATQLAFLDIRGQLRTLSWPLQHPDGAQFPVEAHPSRQVPLPVGTPRFERAHLHHACY